jgi:hypothetical protein
VIKTDDSVFGYSRQGRDLGCLVEDGGMDGGGNNLGIPVFSGESPGKIEIIRPRDFYIPCLGFQFGDNVDLPEPTAATDGRKNSSGQLCLEGLWYFVSNDLYGHEIFSAWCFPLLVGLDPIASRRFQDCIIGNLFAQDDAISDLQFTVVQ